ncbi:uncharacterized protein LOC132953769 [Metopolophium dirhodum]|uniref:uncharacterized protein LOC132953769 n=1 Tax=Metopolophium dirhodum TaxID=44670 RepID=UPI00298F9F57|nr:uncharacterized protein LOC132953769 [Metopolophium dirhodum]
MIDVLKVNDTCLVYCQNYRYQWEKDTCSNDALKANKDCLFTLEKRDNHGTKTTCRNDALKANDNCLFTLEKRDNLRPNKRNKNCLVYTREYRCQWDENTCRNAVLKICQWDENTCRNDALKANEDSLFKLEKRDNRGTNKRAATLGIKHMKGNEDCLLYTREYRCQWDENTCRNAVLKICHWEEDTCSNDALKGKKDCLVYTREYRCHWDENRCRNDALKANEDCLL